MKSKRILFFAPNFFNYEIEIKNKLEALGFIVDLYDDRPSNSFLIKALIRINPKLIHRKIRKYFSSILSSNEFMYDYIFFIKCEAALEQDLLCLKKKYPKAKMILYLYDSVNNIKYFEKKAKYFDQVYSFDLEDVKKRKGIKFLPLFYIDEYTSVKDILNTNKYAISFIGTAHSDRARIINKLRKELEKKHLMYYFKLYVPSYWIFYIKKIFNKDFRELNANGCITCQKLSTAVINSILDDSEIILDIHHPKQSGLTMRTIELIGKKKKILTTNEHIQEYDFYCKNNIFLLNRNDILFDFDKYMNKYIPIPEEIYKKYSLDSWIKEIFNREEIL